jgi:hypothetical protein
MSRKRERGEKKPQIDSKVGEEKKKNVKTFEFLMINSLVVIDSPNKQ